MPRYPMRATSSYVLGPGRVSTTLKVLIAANVAVFLLQQFVVQTTFLFGLIPSEVVRQGHVWQLVSYMFLHASPFHIIFNMLALWMFGGELERLWGPRYFLRFYFLTGIGAALLTVVFAFTLSPSLQHSLIVGASGAIYGLLLAYGLYFPDRPIYMYFVFPIPAKYFVLIMGALAFYSSISEAGGVAHAAHLGGLLVGYALLKGGRLRLHPWAEVKYRYMKWKIGRMRKRFDVYPGGRTDDWDRRIH